MSREDFLPFTCPHCGQDFLAEVWTVINADENPQWRGLIQRGQLNVVPCDHCETAVFVPAPVIFHDGPARRVACFVPDLATPREVEETVAMLLAQLAEELQELPPWAHNPDLVEETMQLAGDIGETPLQPELDLTAALQDLSAISSEEELVEVFNAHPELMSPEVPDLLDRVVQQACEQGNEEAATYFANLRDFLSSQSLAREEEMELESLDEASDPEAALHALIQVDSLDEVVEVVEDYPELLSPQAVNALRRLAYRAHESQALEFAARLSTIADLIDDWLTALALEALEENEAP